MVMTSREIIQRHLEFAGPDRIGLNFTDGRADDFCEVWLGPSPVWRERRWTEGRQEFYTDEWGNTWFRMAGMGRGGEIYQPALTEWDQLKDYRLPDMAAPERYSTARRKFAAEKERYRLGGLPGFPFAICRYLRKMENYFKDLLLERARVDELHDRVTALLVDVIAQYAQAGADGVFFCEDWGTQERLLVSPAMWREIFKPLFRRLCAAAHERGLHVLMHSCGNVRDILGDLAEAGVNCVQFDQPALYGLEPLAERLQALRLCLFSPVDIQQVLPSGDRARIVAEARRMAQLFSGRRGGFIARNYSDLKGIGVQPEWDRWAYETFLECAGGKIAKA
ncbi:MAG: uroporphyrinogen decarboxylase family protein [Candidatus Brocadiia bacterium]